MPGTLAGVVESSGVVLQWITASAQAKPETREQLVTCWRDVSNAGGAVGFPFLPVDDDQVRHAVDAMVDVLVLQP